MGLDLESLRCVTKRGSLGCLLTLDSYDAMPCDASTSLPVSGAWGQQTATLCSWLCKTASSVLNLVCGRAG
jgi:hypothetical protein